MGKEKSKKPFYKKWWFIGIVLLVIISAVAVGGNDSDKSADNDVAEVDKSSNGSEEKPKEEIEITITGAELAKAFDENEVKAKNDYTGKKAEITGKISDIGESFGQTYLVLESYEEFALVSVQCMFKDKNEIEKIVNLNKGDEVTIVGTIGEKSINVDVKDCKIK